MSAQARTSHPQIATQSLSLTQSVSAVERSNGQIAQMNCGTLETERDMYRLPTKLKALSNVDGSQVAARRPRSRRPRAASRGGTCTQIPPLVKHQLRKLSTDLSHQISPV